MLARAKSFEIAALIQAVEDAQRPLGVARHAANDDAIGPFGFDRNLISNVQAGPPQRLDRKGHLVLAGDPGHTFTIA